MGIPRDLGESDIHIQGMDGIISREYTEGTTHVKKELPQSFLRSRAKVPFIYKVIVRSF